MSYKLRCRKPVCRSLIQALVSFVVFAWFVSLAAIAFREGIFIDHHCDECYFDFWTKPLLPESKLIISYIRQNIMDKKQDQVADPLTPRDYQDPPWKDIGNWNHIQDVIKSLFVVRENGFFVEVGAGDGVFLSHTAWLETEKGWNGLLLEPRQAPYKELRRRRKAYAAQVCASRTPFHRKEKLWSPNINKGSVPEMFAKVAEGKSTLVDFVAPEDQGMGKISSVQCFTLNSLMMAAIGKKTPIDLMVIHTMGGEADILDTISDFTILMLVVRFNTKVDRLDVIEKAKMMKMRVYDKTHPSLDNFLVLLHENVQFVKGD